MSKEAEKIEYHYGFYGVMGCKYECGFTPQELELRQEVELGARPLRTFATLEGMGLSILATAPGIYCMEVAPFFTVQVVLIPQLPKGYEELKALAPGARKDDVRKVLADASNHQDQGYLENIKAMLRISMAANPELYEEIREEGFMVDVFERIFSKSLFSISIPV